MAGGKRSREARGLAGDVGVAFVEHKAITLGAPALLTAVLGVVVWIVASGWWQLLGLVLVVVGLVWLAAVVALRTLAQRGIRRLSGPSPRRD
jgi:hypothetical protein